MLSQTCVKTLLHYNPETGLFTWLKSPRYGWVGKTAGCLSNNGGVHIKINGMLYQAHRLVWLYVHGYLPPLIDHINGNRADNCIANLRVANKSENAINSKKRVDNKSGYKGVHWHKQSSRWRACIRKDGIGRTLGNFKSPEEAHEAYKNAALELHGSFANFG